MFINCNQAVRIPIKSEPYLSTNLFYLGSDKIRMRGAATDVDLGAIRFISKCINFGS